MDIIMGDSQFHPVVRKIIRLWVQLVEDQSQTIKLYTTLRAGIYFVHQDLNFVEDSGIAVYTLFQILFYCLYINCYSK